MSTTTPAQPGTGTPGPVPCGELRAADVEVTPGVAARFPVELTSRMREVASFTVTVVGLEPGWVDPPVAVGPVRPGETVTFDLHVRLPVGYPSSSLAASVSALPASEADAWWRPVTWP